MTKKKNAINSNQRTLFDIKATKFFDKNNSNNNIIIIDEPEEFGLEHIEVRTANDNKRVLELLETSNIPKTEKIMAKVLYEKGIMDYNEIMQMILESRQREYFVKEEESDPHSTAGVKIPSEYDFSDWVLISNVKQRLEERGLKQSWLQEKTQIPISTLRSIITNEKSVSLENAMKISIVMNEPINKLFSYVSLSDIATKL
jgi:hypothetical protein